MSLLFRAEPHIHLLLEEIERHGEKTRFKVKAFNKLEPLKLEEPALSGEQHGSTNRLDMDKVVGTCPTIQILMNNVPLICLVDTGSQVTTITNSLYEQFVSHFPGLMDVSAFIKVNASNGLDIPLVGLLIVSIPLEKHQ